MSTLKLAAMLLGVTTAPLSAAPDANLLFQENCASCHAETRLGGTGPALIPQTLKRLKGDAIMEAIRDGRPATQMPVFSDSLTEDEIKALADLVKTPLDAIPPWGAEEIAASLELNPDYVPADKPQFSSDPMNLFIVVETGDHHASLLDGDSFERLTRFPTPFAVHGGPKFTSDGRYVFFMSRDGWVMKYDIWSMQEVGRVRGALNSRNIALSSDNKHIALANYLPHTLVILSADDLSVEKIIDIKGSDGKTSRVSAVYQAPPRNSFIMALKDIPEVWEVFYGEDPPFYGFVHDYRDEGPPEQTDPFPVRRIKLDDYLDDFFFDQKYEFLMGAARNAKNGQVVDLVIGRKISDLALSGLPHLGSGISWNWQGKTVMATPHLRDSKISVIDMKDWSVVKTIPTKGPGFFMRSHEKSRYAWTDVFFGPNKDLMHIIDKQTLEIVRTLKPAPGKTAAHIEFDRDGSHAILSIWENDGAIVIYNAETFEEVKRIPMSKPSGKYNVWNKITFSEGTSH
ncbi:cytochrome D1 domain-containing protein [Coralliovum pocilloporae]|uniref:cytochrome D1 domain-containing protein n=1 Tax=Coralliovum pocilloporae TaxID=3066369 RepID=UPI0033071786